MDISLVSEIFRTKWLSNGSMYICGFFTTLIENSNTAYSKDTLHDECPAN